MALFILPTELLLEIVHLSDSGTQKSLSLTSRNLLGLSQKRLFNCFRLALLDETTNEGDDLFLHLISRIDGIIQDERLSSYISSLELEPRGGREMVIHPRLILAVERLFDGIDRFVALMNLKIIHMHISCTMATKLMTFITFHALEITLGFCSYPGDEWRFPEDDTRLTKLSLFHSEASIPTEAFIIRLLQRSRTNLKELVLIKDEKPGISSLPCPLPTLVSLTIRCHMPEAQAFCDFLVQNPTIEELSFLGLQDVSPLPLPATALPALRFLGAPSEWVGVLVPGRPLASVHIHTNAEPHDVRQLQYSTRPITNLTLRTIWAVQELIVETFAAMVTSTPHLQIFTLVFLEQFFSDVVQHICLLSSLRGLCICLPNLYDLQGGKTRWIPALKDLTAACPELDYFSWTGKGSITGWRTDKLGVRSDGIKGEWLFEFDAGAVDKQ